MSEAENHNNWRERCPSRGARAYTERAGLDGHGTPLQAGVTLNIHDLDIPPGTTLSDDKPITQRFR